MRLAPPLAARASSVEGGQVTYTYIYIATERVPRLAGPRRRTRRVSAAARAKLARRTHWRYAVRSLRLPRSASCAGDRSFHKRFFACARGRFAQPARIAAVHQYTESAQRGGRGGLNMAVQLAAMHLAEHGELRA